VTPDRGSYFVLRISFCNEQPMFATTTWSPLQALRQAGWDVVQKLKARLQMLPPLLDAVDERLDALKRQRLHPLLDHVLRLWGDRRAEQRTALQASLPTNALPADERQINRGIPIRTGLRGGVCVDVNDPSKAALQTLTNALGGTAMATVTPVTAAPVAAAPSAASS
jgi:hypothetical protein